MCGSVILQIFFLGCVIFFSGIWSQQVTYPSESVCGLQGQTIFLSCFYNPGSYWIQTRYWYKVWVPNSIPKDLKEEPEYKSRIYSMCRKYSAYIYEYSCSVRIEALRESDSGVYYYGFKPLEPGSTTAWIHGSPGITLEIVSDVQLEVDPASVTKRWIQMRCTTSCNLGRNAHYAWYKNGNPTGTYTAFKTIDSGSVWVKGSYWCEVRVGEMKSLKSPPVCVLGPECWGVTHGKGAYCVLKGSSVVISCSYKYPGGHQFEQGHWYRKQPDTFDTGHWSLEPVSLDPQFRDRLETTSSNCSLTISNLTERDSGVYFYRFKTTSSKWFTAKTGVQLSVTGLRVNVTPATVTEGQSLTLTCSTTCTLSDNSATYSWYKNSQPLTTKYTTDNNQLYLNPVNSSDSGLYTCAIRGLGGLSTAVALSVRYPPRNTSVSVSPSGEIDKAQTVVLFCESQANPKAHAYSWYKKSGPGSVLKMAVEELNLTLTSGDEGMYHCEAHNDIGSQNSSVTEVKFAERLKVKRLVGIGAIILAVSLLGLLLSILRKKNCGFSERTEHKTQADADPVYANLSAMAMPVDPAKRENVDDDDDDDVEYANIHLSASEEQEESCYSAVQIKNFRPNVASRGGENTVIYSAVSSPRI